MFLLGCFQTRIIKITYPFRPKIGESYSYPLLRWGFPMHRVPHLWHKPTVHAATTWVPLSISCHGNWGTRKNRGKHEIHTVFHVVAFEPRVTSILWTSVTLWQDKLWVCIKVKISYPLQFLLAAFNELPFFFFLTRVHLDTKYGLLLWRLIKLFISFANKESKQILKLCVKS